MKKKNIIGTYRELSSKLKPETTFPDLTNVNNNNKKTKINNKNLIQKINNQKNEYR